MTDEAPAARRLYESAGYQPDGHGAELGHTPGHVEVSLRKRLSP